MVKVLVALVRGRSVALLELAGAGLIVSGLHAMAGPGAAAIGAGVAVLAKSLELDLTRASAVPPPRSGDGEQ